MAKPVPGMILVLAMALAAVVLVNLATGAQPDYADLMPAPASIVWREGDESELWLSSNRRAVDMRVDSIAVGIDGLSLRAESGEVFALGEGVGCLAAVVSGVEVTNTTSTSATLTVSLDRMDSTARTVYWRSYKTDADPPDTPSSATTTLSAVSITLSSLVEGDKYRADVSLDEHFPAATTRSATFTAGDSDSATSDQRGVEIPVLEGTGVRMIACNEHEDVVISLHGDDGAELNRYLVDVLAAAAVNAEPDFVDGAYTVRQVCVDDTASTAAYLSGNEQVGAAVTATDADSDTLTYALGAGDPNDHYVFRRGLRLPLTRAGPTIVAVLTPP